MRVGVVFKAIHKFYWTRSQNSFGFFRSGPNCLRFPMVNGDGKGQGTRVELSRCRREDLNASWRGRYFEIVPETQIHIIPSARALCTERDASINSYGYRETDTRILEYQFRR